MSPSFCALVRLFFVIVACPEYFHFTYIRLHFMQIGSLIGDSVHETSNKHLNGCLWNTLQIENGSHDFIGTLHKQ